MPLCAILLGLGLKEHDFRKCADTPFCGRHRAPSAADFQYVVDEASVSPLTADGKKISGLTATLRRPEPGFLPLSLTLNIVGEGTVRARPVHLLVPLLWRHHRRGVALERAIDEPRAHTVVT